MGVAVEDPKLGPLKMGSEGGQFLVETVLLMLFAVGLFATATNQLRQAEVVKKLIGEPWSQVAGMIESGTWQSPRAARQTHPNQVARGFSYDPSKTK